MNWFANLRLLVLARRATIALERIAAAQETQSRLAQSTWDQTHAPHTPPRHYATIDQLDVAAAEKIWEKRQREENIERT